MRAFLLVIISFIFSLTCLAAGSKKVCLKNICIEAEIADSSQKRQQGLMSRERLGDGQGMLFILDEEIIPSFWMKDMRFPLDILWVDKNRKIAAITQDAQPCASSCPNLSPDKKVKFVLELNSGFVEKNQIKSGDKIDF